MIVKLICCEVQAASKEAFSHAQSQWKSLQDLPGFLLQIGGWERKQKSEFDPEIAWVFGFWKDKVSYQNFTRHHHDAIIESNKQIGTYQKCTVNCFETENNSPIKTTFITLSKAESLRISVFNEKCLLIKKSDKQQLKLSLNPLHPNLCNTVNRNNETNLDCEKTWVVENRSTQ